MYIGMIPSSRRMVLSSGCAPYVYRDDSQGDVTAEHFAGCSLCI